jgi:hypothetical protein
MSELEHEQPKDDPNQSPIVSSRALQEAINNHDWLSVSRLLRPVISEDREERAEMFIVSRCNEMLDRARAEGWRAGIEAAARWHKERAGDPYTHSAVRARHEWHAREIGALATDARQSATQKDN